MTDSERTRRRRAEDGLDAAGSPPAHDAGDDGDAQFRLTFEHAPIGMALVGLDGHFRRVNHVLCEVLEQPAERLLASTLADVTHPADIAADADQLASLVGGDIPRYKIAKRLLRGNGEVAFVMLHASRVDGPAGAGGHLIIQIEDVTETRRLQGALQRQEDMYRGIVANMPHGAVFVVDWDMRIRSADGPALARILPDAGFERRDLQGRTLSEVLARGPDRAPLLAAFRQALGNAPAGHELRLGAHVYDLHMVPIGLRDGVAAGVLVFCQDVTERARLFESIRQKQSLLEATLTHIRSGVALLDESRHIMLANQPYLDLFELDPQTVVGLGPEEFAAHVAPRTEDPAAFLSLITGAIGAEQEFVLVRPRRRVLRRSIQALDTVDGRRLLVVWHDITAERDLIVERERQLNTDALTGIGNRRAAERTFDLELARLRRSGTPFVLAVFDVDHFKRVNDVLGHGAGDEVLRQVASVLERAARKTDTIVRWGGEEFVALLPGTLDGAHAFCERARRQVASHVRAPGLGNLTLSAGLVEVHRDDTLAEAFARADQRLYKAKRGGRDRVCAA